MAAWLGAIGAVVMGSNLSVAGCLRLTQNQTESNPPLEPKGLFLLYQRSDQSVVGALAESSILHLHQIFYLSTA